MNRYFETPQKFSVIFGRAVRLHYLSLKYAIIPILLITLVKFLGNSFYQLTENSFARYVIVIVALTLCAYLFAIAFLSAHQAFLDQPNTFLNNTQQIWNEKLPVLISFWLYVGGLTVLYYFLSYVNTGIASLVSSHSPVPGIVNIFIAAILIIYVALFYFLYPLSIIDSKNTLRVNCTRSITLSEKNKYGVIASLFILILMLLLVMPSSVPEYFLAMLHLDIVLDFCVFSVVLPLIINLLLLLIRDSTLRVA